MAKITEIGKNREMRGKGQGADYRPWIKAREVNSIGTAATIRDHKTGRKVELLSRGELYYYYLFRWDDTVKDIREQYPLDLRTTVALSEELGIKHPKDTHTPMTTDFLITKTNGEQKAYSVKSDRSVLDDRRTCEKLYLEQMYWSLLGIEWKTVFKSDINMILVNNIMNVLECYDDKDYSNDYDRLRHKIARKEIDIDLGKKPLCVADTKMLMKEWS